jgi:hypothetical protein
MSKQRSQKLTLKGRYYAVLYGPDGDIKQSVSSPNVVTTNGKEFLASYLNSAATSAQNTLKFIAIGTDATAEAVGNTGLGVELSRHTGTVSYISGAIYQVSATFAAGSGTGAIVEYGLYNTNTGGTLFSRNTDNVINKGASDSLTVIYQLTIS